MISSTGISLFSRVFKDNRQRGELFSRKGRLGSPCLFFSGDPGAAQTWNFKMCSCSGSGISPDFSFLRSFSLKPPVIHKLSSPVQITDLMPSSWIAGTWRWSSTHILYVVLWFYSCVILIVKILLIILGPVVITVVNNIKWKWDATV